MRRPALLLALLAGLSFFLGLGSSAIADSDEGFYAEAAREMVESGDWLTPHFNYEERWQKPVLYYWLTAATYRVAGASEWTARLWSALSGLGLVLLTWRTARRMLLREDAAWLAAAIVATSYGYFAMARLALPDLPLAFCITLTICGGLERRWALAGAAVGLGFLMKGPVAVVVSALVLVPICWKGRADAPVRVRDLAVATAVAAVIALPWYIAMTLEHGAAYLQSFFIGDNLERFATNRFNAPRGFWFYLPIVAGGLFPWSMYLLALPWRSLLAMVRRRRTITDPEWQLLAWLLLPLLFFSVSIGKQPRYILPVLPPLAILLARSISDRIRRGALSPVPELLWATWGTAAVYGILAVLLYRARAIFLSVHPALTFAGISLIVVVAVALFWVGATRRWRLLPAVMTSGAVAIFLAVQFGAVTGVRPEAVERMATLVNTHRQAGVPLGTYQVFERNLGFYTHSAHHDLPNEGTALDFLKSEGPVLLVVRETELPRLESISGIKTTRLGQVRYLNTANVRLRTLVAPIPGQDVETILLVSNR